MSNIARAGAQQALESLNTTAAGLPAAEAARRLREFGPNRIEDPPRTPLLLRLAREFTHFFALILWLAAALAFFAELREPGQGMAALGGAIVAVVLINGGFSFWQEFRAERAVEALRRLLPQQARVLRGGAVEALDAERLVPGDVVLLGAGDNVPADCRLIEASGVRVNAATLTGESAPRSRQVEPVDAGPAIAARNLLLAGTALTAGTARAVVYATGMRTEFGHIAALTHRAAPAVSPLQREIARLSRLVAALAAALGAIFFLIGHAIGLPFWDDLMFAIGIIVANVPEGLLPTVTLSLAMATQRMARRNALVRHLPAVEALGATTVICSDKTGTLTQNRMAVVRVFTGGEPMAAGCWRADPQDRGDGGDGGLLGTVSACHDLVRDASGRWLGDPLELALLEFAGAHAGVEVPARVAELPFDSERRRMSVVCGPPGQRTLHCKGALESLLAVSTRVREGERTLPLDTAARARWQTAQDAMAADGLRVIALARRTLAQAETAEESDLTLIGLLGIEDPPRPEVPDAIRRCREAGIKVVMVTGDHPSTALAIGRQIGLLASPAPSVIRGERLAGLTDAELQLALDAPELVFARVSAEQKLRIVRALQAKGHVVAVTGDGVNDAPALEAADVGIAMGIAGTDVAREAADMVLLDDNFASIVNAIEEGRAVFENIRKFLTYILTSNVPELVPYLAFVLLRIPLPLTVVQILAVDLGTDMLPALALGAEPPHPGLMRRPPRPPQERLLSPAVLARAYLFLGPMEAAIAMAAYFFVLDGGGWVWGQPLAPDDPLYRAATTACLAAIVVAQVANAFLCRDARQPGWSTPLSGNPLLAWGIAAELLLITIVVYAPAGQALFGTAPLDAEVWLLAAALASSMLVFEETRKRIARRRDAHAPA